CLFDWVAEDKPGHNIPGLMPNSLVGRRSDGKLSKGRPKGSVLTTAPVFGTLCLRAWASRPLMRAPASPDAGRPPTPASPAVRRSVGWSTRPTAGAGAGRSAGPAPCGVGQDPYANHP